MTVYYEYYVILSGLPLEFVPACTTLVKTSADHDAEPRQHGCLHGGRK
jgi:hypothetical protein